MRESQERYRLLFDKSPLPKWVLDAETLAFLEVNDAAVEHYGYSRDEFRNLTLAHILTSDEIKQFEQGMTAATQAGKKLEGRIRLRHRKKNQETVDVDVRYTEIVYKGRKAMLDVILEVPGKEAGGGNT
jgi:PAS domain S-box-containing protein